MRRNTQRYGHRLSAVALACMAIGVSGTAVAGGYVDGNTVLSPAKAINTGAVSVTPTFNNDQFNDQQLVGVVHNDPVRTPSTADPVSTVSGNNYHDETDVVIRGRNGLNIVFTRTYNSEPSSTKQDRGLGYGWVHSYMMRLKSNDFGSCPNCTSAQKPENGNAKTSSITYTDERGGEQSYLVNETSFAVSSPKGVYDTLALDTPSAGLHTLTFRNGVKYIFETPSGNLKTTPNVVARLKYIDNAWGDRLTLAYDANGRLSAITDNLGIAGRTGMALTYHADGRLKDVGDWTGRKWTYAYDASGNLQSMVNPLSQTLTYGYDAPRHLLTSIAKPVQRGGKTVETRFKYYENGRTFQQTDSYGFGDTLDYDLYRKSTRVTGPRGGVREYFYDDNGRMTKLVEPDGAVLLFENQGDAIRSKKYDGLGYATTYSYRSDKAFTGTSDAFGNVTREQDALNRTIDTTYGPLDQEATVKSKRGHVVTNTYGTATSGCDYLNRPKETRLSALSGSTNVLLSSQCWNANGTLNYSREYLDATRYRETRLTYDSASNGLNVIQEQLVGMPANLAITKTYTYDSLGRKLTETVKRRTSPTDATLLNLTTTYVYDVLDRVVKVTDSLGNEVLNNYDANGQLWKETHRYKKADGTFDVRDVVTRTYDAADRVKTETDAEGGVKTYSYDEAGNVVALQDAEGHTSRFEYDLMNRRTVSIDATGYRTETAYNLRGEPVAVTNANGETTKFEMDALGRKTAVVDAKGYRSEFQYDEYGNLTCTIDANAQAALKPKNSFNCSEYRTYDELNRVTKVVDALNGETSFTYNLVGNRLTVKDAENKTWSFAYDDLGRLTTETDHSAKIIAYKPDELGNVYEKTNRLGEVKRYTYDNGNRLKRVDYLKDSTWETFGYDAAGNRNAAANPTVSYTFTFDRLNRALQKVDGRGRNMSFTFDKVGNMLTKTTYQGSTTRYVYNAANRLVMLRNPDYLQVDYQYDPAGRLLSRVTSAGARSTYQYDANGWLSRLAHHDGANAVISDTSYTRDRGGNILTQTDASGTTTYTQDALYRLKTADYPGTVNDEAFEYDKVGNRKQYTKGALVAGTATRYYNYNAGSNRLLDIRIGSATGTVESAFTQDFEGRLTAQTGVGARTLTWDAKGRVKTVGAETYTYDPMDYRIGRSGGALGNLSYFLEGEHLESVYSGGTLQAKYFRGSTVDELVAGHLYEGGVLSPFIFHHDQVMSTSAVSGHNGGTLQKISYTAFGDALSSIGSSPNRQKYTGREEDGTGLMYYRARYYDSAIGRFVSEDPKGFSAGINFYAYVDNNPSNANDPMGLDTTCVGNSCTFKSGGISTTPFTRPEGFPDKITSDSWFYHLLNAPVPVKDPGLTLGQINGGLAAQPTPGPANNPATPLGTPNNASPGGLLSMGYDSWPVQSYVLKDVATGSPIVLNVTLPGHPLFPGVVARYTSGTQGNYTVNNLGEGTAIKEFDTVNFLVKPIYKNTWENQTNSILDGLSSQFGGAMGGFLLYPNKLNSNQSRSVYAK